MNTAWLEKLMAQKGLTLNALRTFHIGPPTIRAWADGAPARLHTVRKLAVALNVECDWLIRNLGVKIVNEKKRSAAVFTTTNQPDLPKKKRGTK